MRKSNSSSSLVLGLAIGLVIFLHVRAALISRSVNEQQPEQLIDGTSFHYSALHNDEGSENSGGGEIKYLVDVEEKDETKKEVVGREKRDLASIHQQPPLLRQFQKKNYVRIDTYELDNQKKRQLVTSSSAASVSGASLLAASPHLQSPMSSIMAERDDENDKSKGVCLYANVNVKIAECFEKHHDCK